jgi:predicted nucleic acid-binding protein
VFVVDASVLAPAIADGGPDGRRFRIRLANETVVGPDLLRIEFTSVVQRQLRAGRLTADQAAAAVADLVDLPVRVFPTAPLLTRVWDLRDNLSPYDACYVALAEALEAPLLTADKRLANAPGIRCRVEVIGTVRSAV